MPGLRASLPLPSHGRCGGLDYSRRVPDPYTVVLWPGEPHEGHPRWDHRRAGEHQTTVQDLQGPEVLGGQKQRHQKQIAITKNNIAIKQKHCHPKKKHSHPKTKHGNHKKA